MDSEKDISTEEKILISASKVFTEKGFSGTRTRDIAEEAGYSIQRVRTFLNIADTTLRPRGRPAAAQ